MTADVPFNVVTGPDVLYKPAYLIWLYNWPYPANLHNCGVFELQLVKSVYWLAAAKW